MLACFIYPIYQVPITLFVSSPWADERAEEFSTIKNRRSNRVCLSERYSLGTVSRDNIEIFRERISLISFHRLINQKQEDWNKNKEKNFYPKGNGAFFFCWWFLWLDVTWGTISWSILSETFLHSERSVLYRPTSSSFDWSTAASTVN